MSALQKINLGTAPEGRDGDTVRIGFTKMNANADVLATQAALTSATPITSNTAVLDSTHVGKRVVLRPSATATLTWPKASTCVADGVILVINASAFAITLAASPDDSFANPLALGAYEALLAATDGFNAWSVLMRGRSADSNERVSGNLSVSGNTSVSGTLSAGATTVSGLTSTGAVSSGGNLSFSNAGPRIQGDMSNAVVANRVGFQTTVQNGITIPVILPNGTGSIAGIGVYASSDPSNSSFGAFYAAGNGGEVHVEAGKTGSGAYSPMQFYTGGSLRVVITPGGSVLVGSNSFYNGAYGGQLQSASSLNLTRLFIGGFGTNQGYGAVFQSGNDAGPYALLFLNSSGSVIGSITTSASSTSFNTTSDYRLKENVEPLTGAIARLKLARPRRFNFNTDPTKRTVDGFIAHELEHVVPEAVSGIRDAVWHNVVLRDGVDPANVQPDDVVDVTTEIVPQQVDHTRLVPLLTAALQEAVARIEKIEQRLSSDYGEGI